MKNKVDMASPAVQAAIYATVSRHPSVVDATKRLANAIAEDARRRAPKDTGAGARSIKAVREYDPETRRVRYLVSWDKAHFYMGFFELGSENVQARPFLRPAADSYQRTTIRPVGARSAGIVDD